MTNDPEVDHFAILCRYGLTRRPLALLVLGMIMLAVPSLEFVNGDAVREQASRLQSTLLFAEDADVSAEAQRRLTALQATWWYRHANGVRYGAMGLGFLLFIASMGGSRRARRAVARARAGRCMACGYDLRGSGVQNDCPECGGPPAPLKAARKDKRLVFKWARYTALIFGAFALYYIIMVRAVGGGALLGTLSKWKVERAFHAAPQVQLRWVRVVSDDGSWQYAYRRDAESGFVRQEWWEGGAPKDVIADQYGEDCARYLPATGVTAPARENVGPDRLEYYDRFADSHVGHMAGRVWYESERIDAGPDREVYRSFRRSGLHDHHAEDLSVVVVDAKTRRPLYEWEGTYGAVLEPDAIPPLRRLWITEIEYPDSPASPEQRVIEAGQPGVLRADWGPYPPWLEKAWVSPILDD